MALIAGAVNAGGFLAIQRYTSHMTGIISGIADDLIVSDLTVVLAGIAALLSFIAGAATTAIFINWARRRKLHSEYALSLALEAALLLLFGLLGANLNVLIEVFVPTTVLLLCFIMGLQNAIMTKVSRAEIRTTHMTGVVTDIGIELGRLIYWNKSKHLPPDENVRANRQKLKIYLSIFSAFLMGGIFGALAFKEVGYFTTVPIAIFLLLLAAPPILRDVFKI
ncbi:YoaK family protein [Zwartia sp.]|uniref:YoaK family protein n=1 Tax=Zwartia sp. TaxID=2978004 RepID=UPI003BAF6767